MASDKPDCNLGGRFWSAALGGIIGLVIGRILEKCVNYYERRYRSANSGNSKANTAGGDDIHALDDLESTLHLQYHNAPITPLGHAISDMDRHIKNGLARKKDWHKTWSDKIMGWFCLILGLGGLKQNADEKTEMDTVVEFAREEWENTSIRWNHHALICSSVTRFRYVTRVLVDCWFNMFKRAHPKYVCRKWTDHGGMRIAGGGYLNSIYIQHYPCHFLVYFWNLFPRLRDEIMSDALSIIEDGAHFCYSPFRRCARPAQMRLSRVSCMIKNTLLADRYFLKPGSVVTMLKRTSYPFTHLIISNPI